MKNKNKKKKYLFQNGIFYIFINDDAQYIAKKYNLKVTAFGNDCKCGFPTNALDKYLKLFADEKIEIASNNTVKRETDNMIKILNKININDITPKEALDILYQLKGYTNHE